MGKVIFFGGKGGVGKTSCSTSFAISRAKHGKVLLVSTDPAHSISDLFTVEIKDCITKINGNLDGMEINPEVESEKYINSIRKNLDQIISPVIIDDINRQLDAASVSPGSHESALFDRMIYIINEEIDHYDYIVFDTAPTGHTLRLLTLPEMLGAWIETLLRKRRKALKLRSMSEMKGDAAYDESDPILRILEKRKSNMLQVREILMDEEKLSFYFVLNAEKMPIEETRKAVGMLRKYDIPVQGLVINKILPEQSADAFWIGKKQQERRYVKEIYETIPVKDVYEIPLFPFDMNEQTIEEMANQFE